EENVLEFEGISLTGNVVGLERVLGNDSFWEKNKIVVLFLGTLLLVVIVVSVLKIKNSGNNGTGIDIDNKKSNKTKKKGK
ncbi:MAG: hypothetical protein Q8N63_02815, partial [Nanoarchaeota archaeon]|nr:hypothetical protein [Nanoarchaeota archaeon]